MTTVAGNFSVEQATIDALRMLEIAGRSDIKVYRGANLPLLHEKSEYATMHHGEWWSDASPTPPSGGFARNKAEAVGAVQFLIDTVNAHPGQVTLMAIGPLTNVAMALRLEPGLSRKVKVTVASLADPSLVTSTELIVDVDTNHDINYGVSVGGDKPWPGAEGAQRMAVQHGLDWDRFIRMFVERVTQAVP